MTIDGSMKAALETAGVNTASARLHTLAWDCLRKAKNNPVMALGWFREKVAADAAMLVEVIGEKQLDAALLGILKSRRADMIRKPGDGGHMSRDAQSAHAPAPRSPNGGGGGHVETAAQTGHASSPAPETGRDGDKGHGPVDAQATRAPSSRPAREPNRVERAAAVTAAKVAAKSIADTFRVGALDGQILGDVAPSSYERLIYTSGRERLLGRMLKTWRDRKCAHVPKDARTRDIIPTEILERMVAFAKYTGTLGIDYLDDDVMLAQMEHSDGA